MTETEEFEFRHRLETERAASPAAKIAPAVVQQAAASADIHQRTMNQVGGLVRGAGSIGASILAPFDMASDALAGKGWSLESNRQRRKDMDAGLQNLIGADPSSGWYQGMKTGAEVGGTLGVGPGLAALGRLVPGLAAAAPNALAAVETAGMAGGNLLTRSAGGAVTGGAAAGLIDPSSAGFGAVVGAAMPGALKVAGSAGSFIGSQFKGRDARAAESLAQALDLSSPQAVADAVAKLNSARALVPGSDPTIAQVLRTPQAGILERMVSDSRGGAGLKERYATQNAARLAALERAAPTSPTGYAQARQDLGESVGRFATQQDAAARARTSSLYQSVPQDEAALYLPELAPIRDRMYGPGAFTDRAAVDKAVETARKIGTQELPAVSSTKAGAEAPTLAQAVRRAGGISQARHDGVRAELDILKGDLKNLVRQNGGETPGRMAMRMHEAGYTADDSIKTLLEALKSDATGRPQFAMGANRTRNMSAGHEAAMGDAPGAETIAKKVTLKDFEDLRSSIGQEARAAAAGGNAKAAKSLNDMKRALDDRIDEVVRGDGAIDENLPIDWANKLTDARKSKLDQVARFRTGPQASIFRTGSDGQPLAQGGEVAAKFWGNRPGVAEDVKSFRRLIDDNPALLGQFRSMVTTEGAGTAANGNLGLKFAKWVDNSLPGMKEAFGPAEVKALQRIAQDIRRSEAGLSAGMSRGSNTYQNAQNALGLGMWDSPLLAGAVDRIPLLGRVAGPALGGAKEMARSAKAKDLANLLRDPAAAANALSAGPTPNALASMLANPELQALILRSAPGLAAGR